MGSEIRPVFFECLKDKITMNLVSCRKQEVYSVTVPANSDEVRILRQKMMAALSSIMDWYNLTPSASRLYAYMFFEDRPITLEEMKSVMGMSKSNMSYAVRSLTEAKMIYKLDYKQNRRDLFRADPDFLTSFQKFFTSKLERELTVMTEAIDDVLPKLRRILDAQETSESTRQGAGHDMNKVLHAKNYYTWLEGFIDGLKSQSL